MRSAALASQAAGDSPRALAGPQLGVRALTLGLVWITIAASGIVFSEPAPVDVLMMGLVIGLPLVGLTDFRPLLIAAAAVWFVCGAGALIATTLASDTDKALTHSLVSLYLYASFAVLAAFVARRPERHTRLLLDAYTFAALIAAAAGIVGYFDLAPGAEIFTKNERATGTFKDPNVFGPFLGLAIVYALHRVLSETFRSALLPAAMLTFLSFALLLSFSRGAWLNVALAIALYLYLSVVTARSNRLRFKIVALGAVALVSAGAVLALAAQHDDISGLLSHRASMQSYDEGPEGRFGAHEKAKRLILDNPLGLGALEFRPRHHVEDPHNVYLVMFLNAGWLGGLTFIAMIGLTAALGLAHALRRTPTQGLYLVAYGVFIGNAVEGFVIDIDHWRHLYLLMAIVWGLMAAAGPAPVCRPPARQSIP